MKKISLISPIFFGITVACFWLIACSTNAQTLGNLSNGLVAYYTFSGNGNDSTVGLNNCSINGAEFAPDRFGNTNSALRVTAQGRWRAGGAYASNNISIVGNTSRTISYWAKFSNQGTGSGGGTGTYTQSEVSWGDESGTGTKCLWSAESTGGLWFQGAWADLDLRSSKPSPAFSEWKMLTITYSGSLRTAVVYVNGTEQKNLTAIAASGFNTILNTKPTPVKIQGGQGDYIDDVRIYNRSLTANEVKQLYLAEAFDKSRRDFLRNNAWIVWTIPPQF